MTSSKKQTSSKTSSAKAASKAKADTAPKPVRPIFATQFTICVELGDVTAADVAAYKTTPQACVFKYNDRTNELYQQTIDLLEKQGLVCRALSEPTKLWPTGMPIGVCMSSGGNWIGFDKKWETADLEAFFAPKPEVPVAPPAAAPAAQAKGSKATKAAPAPEPSEMVGGYDWIGYTDKDIRLMVTNPAKFAKANEMEFAPATVAALKKVKLPKGDLGITGDARMASLTAIAAVLDATMGEQAEAA